MISYEPLEKTLSEMGMKYINLRNEFGGFLGRNTVTKLKNNQNVDMTTIDKICINLDIPVEKVVKIIK